MPVELDRTSRSFFVPEKNAIMWRGIDVANPKLPLGIGVEIPALEALSGRRDLDSAGAVDAFRRFIADIEASASAKYDAAGGRVLILGTDDLRAPVERERLRRTMRRVAPKPRAPRQDGRQA